MPNNTFYIVDTTNVLYQFWYRTRKNDAAENFNSEGEQINVLNAFKVFVQNLLVNENPKGLVFVFDQRLKKPRRKQLDPNYKKQRSATPEALEKQFPWCQQWLEQQSIPQFSSDSVEADDVIAALVKLHRKNFDSMTIISSDKDLYQLIDDNDYCWDLIKDERLNKKQIIKKVGVQPRQIADQLALAGDKSDNIKGVPGVGLHTAAKLLKKFDTIEGLIAQCSAIKTMKFRNAALVHEQIQQHIELIRANKQLTRLQEDLEEVQELTICRH